MKAITFARYGGSDVLELAEIDTPEPGPGEVRIAVAAAGVNPLDWKIRAGYLAEFMPLTFPFVPGNDVAGTVDAVGEGVTAFSVGDAVFAMTEMHRGGAVAEHVTVAADLAAPLPSGADLTAAAAVPLAALTAWQALVTHGAVQPGERVLAHAGAGGVGSFAIQIAKARGAWVAATASAGNAELLRRLGADAALDYAAGAPADLLDGPVDLVLDALGGPSRDASWAALKPGGRLVSLAQPPVGEEEAATHGVRASSLFVSPSGADLREIAALMEAGSVTPLVDTVLPMTDVAAAHDKSMDGHARGKIVIAIGQG